MQCDRVNAFAIWLSLVAALCTLCAISLAERRRSFTVAPITFGDTSLPPPPEGSPPAGDGGGLSMALPPARGKWPTEASSQLATLLPPPKGSPPGGAAQSWHDAFARPAQGQKASSNSLHLAGSLRSARPQSRTGSKVASDAAKRSQAMMQQSHASVVSPATSQSKPASLRPESAMTASTKIQTAQPKHTPIVLAVPVGQKVSSDVPLHLSHRDDSRPQQNSTKLRPSMHVASMEPADWIEKLAAAVQQAKVRKADRARARQQVSHKEIRVTPGCQLSLHACTLTHSHFKAYMARHHGLWDRQLGQCGCEG